MPITASPRLEESLLRTEDARYQVGRNIPAVQFTQISRPELILDKYRHRGIKNMQEVTSVALGSKWQIHHLVRILIILPQLIAGRREESQQYLKVRFLLFQLLYNRSSLLKLSNGRSMEPHAALKFGLSILVLLQIATHFALSCTQLFRLTMTKQRHYTYE